MPFLVAVYRARLQLAAIGMKSALLTWRIAGVEELNDLAVTAEKNGAC